MQTVIMMMQTCINWFTAYFKLITTAWNCSRTHKPWLTSALHRKSVHTHANNTENKLMWITCT